MSMITTDLADELGRQDVGVGQDAAVGHHGHVESCPAYVTNETLTAASSRGGNQTMTSRTGRPATA